MDAFRQNNPELYVIWVLYLMLVFIKTVLCYCSLDAALAGLRKGLPKANPTLLFLSMAISMPFIIFFTAIPTLFSERLRFFTVYRKADVAEDVVKGL